MRKNHVFSGIRVLMANTPSDVAADNVRDINSNPNSLKVSIKRIEQARELQVREYEAFASDLLDLKNAAKELGYELARPTPRLLGIVRDYLRLQTAMVRELRAVVGSVTAALPGMAKAVREARDVAGAYSVEELEKL